MYQDRVANLGAHQGHADRLLARPGVDHGHLIGQQPQHRDLHRGIGAGNTDITGAGEETVSVALVSANVGDAILVHAREAIAVVGSRA